jgi:hypothetical protein
MTRILALQQLKIARPLGQIYGYSVQSAAVPTIQNSCLCPLNN